MIKRIHFILTPKCWEVVHTYMYWMLVCINYVILISIMYSEYLFMDLFLIHQGMLLKRFLKMLIYVIIYINYFLFWIMSPNPFVFQSVPSILVCNAHFSRLSQILMDKINSRPFFVCFWNMSHYVSKIGCKWISCWLYHRPFGLLS